MGRTHGTARRRAGAAAVAAWLLAGSGLAAEEGTEEEARALAAAARAFERSFAHVEIEVRYDEGQPPSTIGAGWGDFSSLVTEERPYEVAGFVLAPDRVLVFDTQLHPRFVAGTTVVFGEERVPARPVSWLVDRPGVVLALDRPLEGAAPLAFDGSVKPPYRAVHHAKHEGAWRTVVGPVYARVTLGADGTLTGDSWSYGIVVDHAGKAVGITFGDSVPLDDSWKGSPLSWPAVSGEERESLVARTISQADAGLLRVHLRLRSPKAQGGEGSPFSFRFGRRDSDDEEKTERDAVGVLVDERRILVLAALDAKTTARLEAIQVHAKDDAVPARFVCSYRHFGALLAEAERPIQGAVRLSDVPLQRHRDKLLLGARLEVQGERRVLHGSHHRISSFEEAWRRQVVPNLRQSADHHFLFDRDGALVALAVERRLPEREERWRDDGAVLLPSVYVAPLLADPTAHADPANVPVAADREDRLAWLGVEFQRLDRDLARANGVSHVTRDGRTGVLVSYVYPGSPAQDAGLEPGVVLLRIHAPNRPKPIDVAASDDPSSSMAELLAEMEDAAEGLEQLMPGAHPWPTPANELNRTLTEIGIGGRFTLEYAVGGVVKKVEMPVVEGPVHYEAAPLHEDEALGTTVRDLTYEVRRYYQLEPGAPGAIVSKVERGSRAAVAGLRVFDIVLRVNDEPVADAASFAKAVGAGGELRLAVKDRLKERVVKVAAPK